MRSTICFAASLLAVTLFAPLATAQAPVTTEQTNTSRFSVMLKGLADSGLTETIGSDVYTIFAPTDEAFAQLPEEDREALLNDPVRFREVLSYHIIPGRFNSREVAGLRETRSLQGERIPISTDGRKVFVGDAVIVQSDINASNGVLHIIDRVLLPTDIKQARRAAFIRRNETLRSQTESAIDVITEREDMASFLTIIRTTPLADELASPDQINTILVPSNDALARLSPEHLQELRSDQEGFLRLLRNHVIEGDYYADDLVASKEVETRSGQKIMVSGDGRNITVAGFRILSSDVIADNGVLHVIDGIIIPRINEATEGE